MAPFNLLAHFFICNGQDDDTHVTESCQNRLHVVLLKVLPAEEFLVLTLTT
jgi:hypothetical protein